MKMTDAEYQDKRNALIPIAEKAANTECGSRPGADDMPTWAAKWNRVFHTTMPRLAFETGLT